MASDSSSGNAALASLDAALDRIARLMTPLFPEGSARRRVLRRLRSVLPSAPHRHPLVELIASFARAYPSAIFVQIGSNDGIHMDPLHDHIVNSQWTGVCVEPQPDVFERLRANYAANERVRLENAAVADENGSREIYYVTSPTDDSMWHTGLASLRRDVVLQHSSEIPDIDARLKTLTVRTITFEALCTKFELSEIDLIHLDTEGYDGRILKKIDLERHRPRLVLFEHYHLEQSEYESCLGYLARHGYDCVPLGMDTACLLRSPAQRHDRRLIRSWRSCTRAPVLAFRRDVP